MAHRAYDNKKIGLTSASLQVQLHLWARAIALALQTRRTLECQLGLMQLSKYAVVMGASPQNRRVLKHNLINKMANHLLVYGFVIKARPN